MKAKSTKQDLHLLCGSLRPDDGISPFEMAKLKRKQMSGRNLNHRDLQYAKVAQQTLDLVMSAACSRPPLDHLSLLGTELASGGAVLNVTLLAGDRTERELDNIRPYVSALETQFRAALAGAIRRRRTPVVRVHLLPGQCPEL